MKTKKSMPTLLEFLLKSLKIREELYPDGKHPDLLLSYNNIGMIYLNIFIILNIFLICVFRYFIY